MVRGGAVGVAIGKGRRTFSEGAESSQLTSSHCHSMQCATFCPQKPMASVPILDPKTIDTAQTAVTKEEILELNAQREEFEQVDRLISLDLEAGQAVGVKTQRKDEFWTRGHIPGRPIMPGVLMIEMAAQISSVIYHRKFETGGKKFFGFGGVNDVKFRGTVEPGQDLLMVVRAKALRSRMAIFEAQGFVDGKMVFEGEVSGIVIG